LARCNAVSQLRSTASIVAPSVGQRAIPTLAVIVISLPWSTTGAATAWIRSVTTATISGSSESPGRNTANSSPPKRATAAPKWSGHDSA
jgi:hypothetical protein